MYKTIQHGLYSRLEREETFATADEAIEAAKKWFDANAVRNSRVSVWHGEQRVYAKYRDPFCGSLICEV